MERRAFVGTGLIGAAMVEAALARGESVTVWNRSPQRAEPLGRRGARVAATVVEAVTGQLRVHLALRSDPAVDAVLAQIGPVLAPEAIVLDHSTTSPAGTRARAERCAAQGVRYLHAPVFMSPPACRQARGMIIVSGPVAWFAEVEAELLRMTGVVRHVGPRPDAAAVFKLVGNALNLTVLGGLADAYAMAGRQGISPAQVQQMLADFDLRPIVTGRGARMAAGDFSTQWTLDMARKDLGLMIDAAGEAPLAVWPGLARRMDALVEQGEAARDVAVLGRDSLGGEPEGRGSP
ncbi:MAG: NAD(P)-dependent oxidoreductase [Myxococcota bacterium]